MPIPSACSRLALSLVVLFSLSAPSPLLADPQDRQVAEWALLLGGSVRLEGRPERIREVTKLPAGDFHLELVDLVGTNILPPDLKWLTGLTRLKVAQSARTDVESQLRRDDRLQPRPQAHRQPPDARRADVQLHLSRIDQVQRLAASRRSPRSAPQLRVLSLENTQVRGRNLAPFTNLESLDLVYCPIDDEGLKQIAGPDQAAAAPAPRRRDQRRRRRQSHAAWSISSSWTSAAPRSPTPASLISAA